MLCGSLTSLSGQELAFEGPSCDFSHGPLRVSENHRFIVHADGTPFFYLSDTNWDLFRRATREEAAELIDKRRSQGFTVICGPVTGALDGFYYNNPLGVPNPYGKLPFIDKDVTQPAETPGADADDPDQYDYWDHVDYIVSLAESAGLYVGMMLAWDHQYKAGLINADNARTYARYIGERYGTRPNIIWVLGGDHDATGEENIFREMAAGLAEAGAADVLTTYHPRGGRSSACWFQEDEWLDFNMIQSGHSARDKRNDLMIAEQYDLTPTKPVMDGESRYEDHSVNWDPANGWFDDYDVRQGAYWSLFAGAHGHTYGTRGVWQMYSPERPAFGPVRYYWYDAMDLPGAWDMKHIRNLMLSRPFLSRVPDQTLVEDAFDGADTIRATRGDGYAFIYAATGRTFTVYLKKLSCEKIRATWFDPRTGNTRRAGEFPSQEYREFDPPGAPGRGNDWVLVLDDVARNFPPPGAHWDQAGSN